MSRFLKDIRTGEEKSYATFEWGGQKWRLYRVSVEANARIFDEARLLATEEVLAIPSRMREVPADKREWEALKAGLGASMFDEPANRYDQLKQSMILAQYGRLVIVDSIKGPDGENIYDPSSEELEEVEGWENMTHEQKEEARIRLYQEARGQMLQHLKTDLDLQAASRKASDELVPEWLKEHQKKAMEAFAGKKKPRRERREEERRKKG